MRFLEFELKREARIFDEMKGPFLTLGVNYDVYMAFSFSGSAADLVIFNFSSPLKFNSSKFLLYMVSTTEELPEENLSDLISIGGLRVERRSTIYIVRNRVRKLHKAASAKGEGYGVRYLSIIT